MTQNNLNNSSLPLPDLHNSIIESLGYVEVNHNSDNVLVCLVNITMGIL